MVSDPSPIGLPFLDALAASARPADRQLWLRIAADTLIALPADAPRRQAVLAAAEIALRTADAPTRSAFARRLAPYPGAADALAAVAALGGEAALVVLAEAAALPRETSIRTLLSIRKRMLARNQPWSSRRRRSTSVSSASGNPRRLARRPRRRARRCE